MSTLHRRGFEKKRQEIFRQQAEKGIKSVDPDTLLLKSHKLKSKGSVHSRAAGWNLWRSSYVATALAMTGREEPAWKIFNHVLDYQDTNPESMTYGNFRAHSGWDFALDPNALSFMIPQLWYVYKNRGSVMPKALKERMEKGFILASDAVNAHRGGHLNYTNIILLNLASRLCIADVMDMPRVRAVAGWEWEEWRNYILKIGFFPEYNAPGYTGVQIYALAIMLACKAPKTLHDEIRNVMRHLIADAVVNYHKKIGLVTGPQTRGHYGVKGGSMLDTVFHFVMGTPEPSDGCHLWLGVPLTREDLLPHVRNLPIPRTNINHSPLGCSRMNYLDRDFTLGSVNVRNRICNPETPFFISYLSRNPQCGIPFIPEGGSAGHFSVQKKGKLVAASVWLLTSASNKSVSRSPLGRFSKLNTGVPHSIVGDDRSFKPGYTVIIGKAGTVKIYDEKGKGLEVTRAEKRLKSPAILIETDSIYAGIRFFGAGPSVPVLTLVVDGSDNMVLKAESSNRGIRLNDLETAVSCGFGLEVVSVKDNKKRPSVLIPEVSGLKEDRYGWTSTARFSDREQVVLEIDARQPLFYTAGDRWVTPNLMYLNR
jgi:hypothetical protein